MQLDRLRLGEITALVGAVVIVVSLFLDWVAIEQRVFGAGYTGPIPSMSGFDAAGWAMVVLLVVVAVLAITLVVLTVTVEPVGLTMASAVGTAFFGILVTLVTVLRLVLFQPDGGVGDANVALELGAYLSLLGVFLCAAGGWVTMKDERQAAPYSAAPVLEPRPAPPVGPPA